MEQNVWDIAITLTVLVGLGLAIWSRVSGMTIPELLRSIRDIFSDTTDELMPEAMILNE